MKLSVITINYNNAAELLHTIKSVTGQSFKGFEYIVIDGGSTDGSVDVIKENADKINLWLSEKDSGIYDAINKGISKATGTHLVFLNSGDSFADNDVLALVNDHIAKYPDVDIFYGDTIFTTNDPPKTWVHKHPPELDLWFFQTKNLNHQSSVIKADLFNEFGLYPAKYTLAADHWLYLISLVAGKKFKHIDHQIAIYNMEGLSHTSYDRYKQEMLAMWNDLVPAYARDLIGKLNAYKHTTDYKIVKTAIAINAKLQKIRQGK